MYSRGHEANQVTNNYLIIILSALKEKVQGVERAKEESLTAQESGKVLSNKEMKLSQKRSVESSLVK
jgi:hypothetical protein